MENKIDLIHTSCKDCFFAKYDGKTQISCHLDMIKKFEKANIQILEAYDEEKEFYVINKKKCVGHRKPEYFINRNLENKSLEEKVEYVQKLLSIHYAIIVNIKNFTPMQLQDLAKKISELNIPPQELFIIRYREDRDKYSYNFMEALIKKTKVKKWKIKTILDNEEDFFSALHHTINENKRHKFIVSINSKYDNLNNIVNYANDTVYNKFDTFEILSNDQKDCLLFNTAVYKFGISSGLDILSEKEKFTII